MSKNSEISYNSHMLLPDTPSLILASSAVGLISGYLAHKRGKNPLLWFILGFLFGIFGLFAVFFAPQPKKKRTPRPTTPQPYLDGPIGRFWYYLDAAHTQMGPMSYDLITKAWKNGTVSPATLVWHEEMTDWRPLQELIKLKN